MGNCVQRTRVTAILPSWLPAMSLQWVSERAGESLIRATYFYFMPWTGGHTKFRLACSHLHSHYHRRPYSNRWTTGRQATKAGEPVCWQSLVLVVQPRNPREVWDVSFVLQNVSPHRDSVLFPPPCPDPHRDPKCYLHVHYTETDLRHNLIHRDLI